MCWTVFVSESIMKALRAQNLLEFERMKPRGRKCKYIDSSIYTVNDMQLSYHSIAVKIGGELDLAKIGQSSFTTAKLILIFLMQCLFGIQLPNLIFTTIGNISSLQYALIILS